MKSDREPYIIVDPNILNGEAHFKDTQITVEVILKEIADGATIAEVIKKHPAIQVEAIKAMFKYSIDQFDDFIPPTFNKNH